MAETESRPPLLSKVSKCFSTGDFAGARLLVRQSLAQESCSYEARVLSGRAALYSGDTAGASTDFQAAVELNPEACSAWEGIAQLKSATGDVAEAAETYQKLLELARQLKDEEKVREYLWRGAEAYDRCGHLESAEEQLRELLECELSKDQKLEALCFLADVQMKLEKSKQERSVQSAMEAQERNLGRITRSLSGVRLDVDAARAEEQECEEGGLADTLKAIVRRTMPCPRFVKYHEAHVQRYLSRLKAFPPRSTARNEKRLQALRACVRMITTHAGGCTTPFPFEAAIWLLEELEELYGGAVPICGQDPLDINTCSSGNNVSSPRRLARISGSYSTLASPRVSTQLNWYRGNSIAPGVGRAHLQQMAANAVAVADRAAQAEESGLDASGRPVVHKVEDFGRKLAHQFPWAPAAYVAVGLALRRRFLSDPEAPSTLARRRQITKALKGAVEAGADSAAGWKALAELQYQNRSWMEAYETSVKGLEWSVRRRAAGCETLTQFALSLRLCYARCLRRLGRLDESEYAFKVLAGWTTEGVCAFDEMCGSPPVSVRQQAMRGLAKIALERGDRRLGKAQYERILGKALIGRGPPAEHWAHSEYAWLVFEDGDLATAKMHLEKAIDVAAREGCAVTDIEIAEHHYKLGRILWTMGGSKRDDPKEARAHFEIASCEECDSQMEATAWLGHWYREVAQKYSKARNCYKKVLAVDPNNTVIVANLRMVEEKLREEKRKSAANGFAAYAMQALEANPFWDEQAHDEVEEHGHSPGRRVPRMMADRAHSANSELAVLAEVLSVLPARSGSVSNSGRLELDAFMPGTSAPSSTIFWGRDMHQ
ncbi:hypothetical protein WJX81_001210 [Elliptochloris bilobata]|uniref:Uncharacterized protein n=1 Tax=Elliptochloris bilobata TaxID=381761 RepID=A0AAW1QZJ8_9CHLO